MSIPNMVHKIKGVVGLDRTTIMFLFIIVGVGIASFGLGRLSVGDATKIKSEVVVSKNINIKESQKEALSLNTITQPIESGGKRYVASKNGKMYYNVGCSGAGRIKPENSIWFATSTDAEKSGFTLSSTCK